MKILFTTDGSEPARVAAQFVRRLPLPAGSAIHVVSAAHVRPGIPEHHLSWQTIELMYGYQRNIAAHAVAEDAELLQHEGITITTEVPQGEPAPQILRAADAFDADLIVVGSRGLTGIVGFFLGSVARSVAKRSKRPVLVARPIRHNLANVLIATDGSAHASDAVRFAATMPLAVGTRFTALHVLRPRDVAPTTPADQPEQFERALAEIREREDQIRDVVLDAARSAFTEAGRSIETAFRQGDPATEILRMADKQDVDLIVAGSRGVSLIEGLLMGSVADRLLKHAPCSVLIVP